MDICMCGNKQIMDYVLPGWLTNQKYYTGT